MAPLPSVPSSITDPNGLVFNPNGTPAFTITRSGWTYLNAAGSPEDKPDGDTYGPGGTTINLGALIRTLTPTPASPSSYFPIGDGTTVTLTTAGNIYAQINDTYYP